MKKMKKERIIRSAKTSMKFARTGKFTNVRKLIFDYKKIMIPFIKILWEQDKISKFLSKEITDQICTTRTARLVQCAGKQASGVVRGTRKLQDDRLYRIDKLKEAGELVASTKLQKIYDKTAMSMPSIDKISIELDSRFIKINLDNQTKFDGWITISSIGEHKKIILPFKRTKQFNKLYNKGTLLKGVRLSTKSITFNFEMPEKKKTTGDKLSIDIGITEVISCTIKTENKKQHFQSAKDIHEHDLNSIINKLAQKRKGSKAFGRAQMHRTNHINWSINEHLDLLNVKQLTIENIKDLRRNKQTTRKLSHWTYTEIVSKLDSYCAERGVLVRKIDPAYTSQRCSACGWVQKSNRNGKVFACKCCGFTADAGVNASINIGAELPLITELQYKTAKKGQGFFWLPEGQEPIVSAEQKPEFI